MDINTVYPNFPIQNKYKSNILSQISLDGNGETGEYPIDPANRLENNFHERRYCILTARISQPKSRTYLFVAW